MWYPAAVNTPPAVIEPVTVYEAKRQCGIAAGDTVFDGDILRLIAAARTHVERYCSIRVALQTVTLKCDAFADFGRVPVVPIQSVTSIIYADPSGQEQTLSASDYELRADDLVVSIVPPARRAWPAVMDGSRITVVAVAGYVPAPPEIVAAILLRIKSAFDLSRPDAALKKKVVEGVGSREWDMSGAVAAQTEQAVADLLAPYRSWAALA